MGAKLLGLLLSITRKTRRVLTLLFSFSSPYYVGTFKLIIMKDLRIDIECILATDSVNLTKVQAKINQWMTKGELVKYEIHTTNTHVVFNICRKKSA